MNGKFSNFIIFLRVFKIKEIMEDWFMKNKMFGIHQINKMEEIYFI